MEEKQKTNIILTGMPASGKSTVGVILAKVLGMDYIDTDLVIQKREKALLCDLIQDRGVDGFLCAEEEAVLSVQEKNAVIATGGSVVYSDAGMIYLKVGKEELFKRLHNIKERGVVLRLNETVEEMFESRSVLYAKYADIVVEEGESSIEETVMMIADEVSVIRRR